MTHPTDDSLKPCPFCGAGTTEITPKGRMWTGMKYSEPSSVSVRHWCEAVPGQPSRMIERVGRDEASAIDAWNTRALLAEQAQEPKAEDAPSDAARDVLAERQRQISTEGWTPEHDDEHNGHEMAHAAACYAYPELTALVGVKTWPWAAEWFKVRDHRSNYVRAAALLLAEIERLDRAAIAAERKA